MFAYPSVSFIGVGHFTCLFLVLAVEFSISSGFYSLSIESLFRTFVFSPVTPLPCSAACPVVDQSY